MAISLEAMLPLDPVDLEVLRAIRAALPSANEMTPQAAFEYTLEALRGHGAKLVDRISHRRCIYPGVAACYSGDWSGGGKRSTVCISCQKARRS